MSDLSSEEDIHHRAQKANNARSLTVVERVAQVDQHDPVARRDASADDEILDTPSGFQLGHTCRLHLTRLLRSEA
jgi:hypothetical protein